jgi:hypothetical protein
MSDQEPICTRSWLFTPATSPERFAKAAEAGADVLLIDLEDAVAPRDKSAARTTALDYLAGPRAGTLQALRINGLDTRAGIADLDALRARGLCVEGRQVDHRDTIDGSRRQDFAHRTAARRAGHDSAHRRALHRHRVRIRKPQGPVLDRARPCADRPRSSAVPGRIDRCRQEAQPHLRANSPWCMVCDVGRYASR